MSLVAWGDCCLHCVPFGSERASRPRNTCRRPRSILTCGAWETGGPRSASPPSRRTLPRQGQCRYLLVACRDKGPRPPTRLAAPPSSTTVLPALRTFLVRAIRAETTATSLELGVAAFAALVRG